MPRTRVRAATTALTLLATVAAACSSPHKPGAAPTTAPGSTTSTTVERSDGSASGTGQSPYTWTRDISAALSVGGGPTATIASVLAPVPGRQWSIAGTRISAADHPSATLWSSPDTVTWTATALTGPGVASDARSAVDWHTAAVVAGSIGQGASQRAAVWISARSGAPFTEVVLPPATGGSAIEEVTAGALGLFAVGRSRGHTAVWSSPNGLHWAELADAERLISTAPGARVEAVLASADAVYVAGSIRGGAFTDGALWSSSDGIHWTSVQSAQAAFSGTGDRVITSMAQIGTALVAVGGVRVGSVWHSASWISPDGASWSQPSLAFSIGRGGPSSPSGSLIRSVASVPPSPYNELLAVGGGDSAQEVWRSTDGVRWSAVGLPPAAAGSASWRPTIVTARAGTVVVADGDLGQPHVLVDGSAGWREASANPAVFGRVRAVVRPRAVFNDGSALRLVISVLSPAQVVAESTSPNAATTVELYSADGRAWRVLPPATATWPAGAIGATRYRTRWVAVGSADLVHGSAAGTSWTSPDTATWKLGGPLSPAHPGDLVVPGGVCTAAPPTGLAAAVGTERGRTTGSGAAAWRSADGVHWARESVTTAAPGVDQQMAGCFGSGRALVAYGSSASDGVLAPAVWKSLSGTGWNRQAVSGLSTPGPSAISSIGHGSNAWLAVAGPVADLALPEDTSSLWLSRDGGASWRALSMSAPAWQGIGPAAPDLVAFAGGTAEVFGTLDGRLTVWLGTPTSSAPSAPSSTATSASTPPISG